MKPISFAFPLHSVMLSDAAGTKTENGLLIDCIINAEPDKRIELNGTLCENKENEYHGSVCLKDFKNILTATDLDTGYKTQITVYYLKNAYKKYRFSLDDNIWFLQNIAKNKDTYKSIFEDPYLTLLKTMHDRYGTKFHLNIYYECPEHGGFNLTQMPDKFKDEWIQNSNWLRLSPHANADKPDRPYIRASYEQTRFEFGRIINEIIRFAGKETYASDVTTIHWGAATADAVRAVRDLGIKALVGSFRYGDPTNTPISMHLDAERCAILNNYGTYYDEEQGVVIFKYSASNAQHAPLEQIPINCKNFAKSMPLYTFFELCVHEQYFYEDYINYMPDYYDRFETAIKWCVENGYEPAFASEVLELDKL